MRCGSRVTGTHLVVMRSRFGFLKICFIFDYAYVGPHTSGSRDRRTSRGGGLGGDLTPVLKNKCSELPSQLLGPPQPVHLDVDR